MVKHLGSYHLISFFFANYKLAYAKNVRSFLIPISPQLLLLVKKFYKANLIYRYSFDYFKNSIVIYPRFNIYFKDFQVKLDVNSSMLSVRQLTSYHQSGYNFIIFSPFVNGKFITSTEFLYTKTPGYLLAVWLFSMPFKSCFFRPEDFFLSLHINQSTSKNFRQFYTFSLFSFNFQAFALLTHSKAQKLYGFPSFMFSNAFQGFFNIIFKHFFLPSYAVLHLKGIGYKCYHAKLSNKLVFNTGFNHYSIFTVPTGVNVKIRKTFFALFSIFGSVKKFVRIIRAIRFPDPYRAKGFRYKYQLIKFKIGKQRLS